MADQEVYALVEDLFADERKKFEEADRLKEEQLLSDFEVVLKTPQGKRFLWWLLGETHIFHSMFTGQSNGTIFRNGEHSVGLRVLKKALQVDEHIFAKMLSAQLKSKPKEN